MWVETEDGAVSLDHVKQIIITPEGHDFKLHFALDDGWGVSAGIYYSREEAKQKVAEYMEHQNNPLRVVTQGATHEHEDETGAGP